MVWLRLILMKHISSRQLIRCVTEDELCVKLFSLLQRGTFHPFLLKRHFFCFHQQSDESDLICNNNNNNRISIAPYGCNFRGAICVGNFLQYLWRLIGWQKGHLLGFDFWF